jgi:integrase/recombinase XerD
MASLKHFIDPFLEMLSSERGCAYNTQIAYKSDLEYFFTCLGKEAEQDISEQHITAYLSILSSHQLSPTTRARHLSTLRQYFKFLFQEGYITSDPTLTLQSPHSRKSLPKILLEEEVFSLLEAAKQITSIKGIRAYCLLELLYSTGVRVSELLTLLTLSVEHALKTKQPYLLIKGKGGKERIVPLSNPAIKALKEYLEIRSTFIKPGSSSIWLFPSKGGKAPLTRQGFGKLLKEVCLKAGIDSNRVSPHVLRHAFATHLLNRGADLISVQHLLGHADITTTEIYTHVMIDKMEKLVLEHHPLSKGVKVATTEEEK